MHVPPDDVRDRLASHAQDVTVGDRRRDDDGYAVYGVRLDGDPAVCKLWTTGAETDRNPPAVEAATCRVVGATGTVRAPSVVAIEERTLVLALPDGDRYDPEAPAAARDRRVRAVGGALARLHRATADRFVGCGELTVGGDLAVADPEPWAERFPDRVEAWLAPLGPEDADLARAVREAVTAARDAGLFDGLDHALVHGWPKLLDVRFGDGAGGAPDRSPAIGLADWSAAAAAPPEFDLAHARLDCFDMPYAGEDPGFFAALLAGYRAERTPPRRSADRRRLYRAALTAQYLPRLVEGARSGGLDFDPQRLRNTLRSYAFDCLDAVETPGAPTGEGWSA